VVSLGLCAGRIGVGDDPDGGDRPARLAEDALVVLVDIAALGHPLSYPLWTALDQKHPNAPRPGVLYDCILGSPCTPDVLERGVGKVDAGHGLHLDSPQAVREAQLLRIAVEGDLDAGWRVFGLSPRIVGSGYQPSDLPPPCEPWVLARIDVHQHYQAG